MIPIPLRGKAGEGLYALIDDVDFPFINQYKWYLHKSKHLRYARAVSDPGKTILMHRMLMHISPGKVCDHKDGNGLNNQRYNLREATRSQNGRNRQKIKVLGSSKYKGVCWSKPFKCWVVNIKLGDFKDELEAARAYDKAATALFGDFASINGV